MSVKYVEEPMLYFGEVLTDLGIVCIAVSQPRPALSP